MVHNFHPPQSLLPSLCIKGFLPELNCSRYYKEYQDNSEIPLRNLKFYRNCTSMDVKWQERKQIICFKIYKKERSLSIRGPGKNLMEKGVMWPGPPNKMPKTRGDGEEQRTVNGVMVTRAQGEKSREQTQEGCAWSQKPSAPQKGTEGNQARKEAWRWAAEGPAARPCLDSNATLARNARTRTPCLDRQHHAPHSS